MNGSLVAAQNDCQSDNKHNSLVGDDLAGIKRDDVAVRFSHTNTSSKIHVMTVKYQ